MNRELEPIVKVALAIAGTALFVGTVLWLVLWRSDPTVIVVEDRWWTAWTSVKYDRTTVDLVPVTHTTCTGYGSDRSCTTTTTLEMRTTTTTYTRCTTQAQGRKLPITHPEPGCAVQSGDYLGRSEAYRVVYHVEEQTGRSNRAFVPELWGELEPGAIVTVRWSAAGTIREAVR